MDTTKFKLVFAFLVTLIPSTTVSGFCQEPELASFAETDEVDEYKYEPNPNRVRLKSVVDEVALRRFRNGEPIVILVPEAEEQVVGSIRLEKAEFFKSQPLTMRFRTKWGGDSVSLAIPWTALERLDYQPIEIPIYQSQVSSVRLYPEFKEDEVDFRIPTNKKPDFYVRLKPRNGVAVSFEFDKSFRVTNDIIDANLPFPEIDGIFFDEGKKGTASVVMRNGDNISGKHYWPESVEFETPWGKETLNLEQVISVTRNREVKLVPSGFENPKWIIQNEEIISSQKSIN